jgi:hypothetical protein
MDFLSVARKQQPDMITSGMYLLTCRLVYALDADSQRIFTLDADS